MNPNRLASVASWISTATFNAFLNAPAPPAAAEPSESQQLEAATPGATASEYVIVSGTVKRDGSGAQIDPVYHITTAQPQAASQSSGNHCLQFSNGSATLGQYCFDLDVSTAVAGLDQQVFAVAAPWPAGTSSVVLMRGSKQVASLTRAAQDPVVTIQSPHAGDRWQGNNTIAWSTTGAASANTLYTIFYSADGGNSWLPLVHDLSDTSYSFDTAQILGGSQVSFRVVAASGLNSGSATVGPIQVTQTPKIGATVPALDFGNVMVGQGASRSIGITSTGSGPLTITGISIDNPAFTVFAKAPTAPVVVGGRFPLTVFLSPSASGKQTGNLIVKSNDPNTPALSIPLTAQASNTTAASIFASATTLDFGSAPVSQNADQVVTITNTGSADLQVTAINSSDKQFTAVSPATPFTVPIGSSTDVTLRFKPSATGPQSANITFASNDPTHSSYAIPARGTGVAASNSPQISAGGVVNGASFQGSIVRGGLATIFGSNFASIPASASSLPLPTLLGGVQVTVGGIPAPLVYVSQGQINFQVPFEVPPGSSTPVVVSLNGVPSPVAIASVADYGVGVFTYARTATALDPIIVHASTNQLVTPSNPALPNEVLVVYATGVGKLTNPPLTGGPAPSGPLAMAVDNPTITLGGAPVGVLFTGLTPGFVGLVQINIQLPGSFGAGSAQLVISFPGSTPATVSLAVGNAVSQPKLTLSMNSLAYGNVAVNQSKDLSVQLSNTGSATLNASQVRVTGAGFTLLTAASFSVPAGQSATVTVRFTPTSASSFNGSLTIASNDPASPATISLSGSGGPAITASPASLDLGTVAVGQTSQAKPITVTNNSAASITVSLFASAPFSVAPTSLTIGANSSGNASVTFAPTIAGSVASVLNIVISGQSTAAASVSLTGTASASSGNTVLKVDGGQFNTEVGYPSGASTAYFVNRLTPTSYPATITGVQLYFRTRADGLPVNTPLTVISATTPSGSSSISIFSAGTIDLISGKLSAFDQFVTYTVPSRTITSGDFLVGFMVQNPQNVYPADVDQLTPSQLRSYISSDGLSFSILDTFGPSLAGNLGIRAVVTLGK